MQAVTFDEKALTAISGRLVQSGAEYMRQEAAQPTGQDFARWLATNRPAATVALLGLFFNALLDALRPVGDAADMPAPDSLMLDARLNERQIAAVRYMQQWGRVSNYHLRKMFPEVTGESLRLDMANLVDKGIANKVGDKRGAFYMLRRRSDGDGGEHGRDR